MTHSLEDCEISPSTQDYCDICGELSACVCLAPYVQAWEIAPTGLDGWMSYRYQYQERESLIARFGYAATYRDAIDAIAHATICKREGASA